MIKEFLKLFFIKLLPVKKNRILFISYDGLYSDSPKLIFEELVKRNINYEFVWALKQEKKVINSNTKIVKINSFKYYYYYGTAQIIIDNVYGYKEVNLIKNNWLEKLKFKIKTFLKKKTKQKVYTFWHGTPLKKMGRDQVGMNIIDFNCYNTTMILGNEYTLNIMNNLTFFKLNMKLLGSPRNDVFFNIHNNDNIKMKLKLPLNKKIVLFAPSFRSDFNNSMNLFRSGINQIREIDFDLLFKTLHQKFGGDWVFICRFHYHVSEKINWDEINKKYAGTIINGNLSDDMSLYLQCSDVLITDVSSSMFDFIHTNKPIFLFFPDVEYYKSKERGLYYPIEKLPFSCARSFNELINNIKSFDNRSYINNISKLIKKFHYVDHANSSKEIADYIIYNN